MNKDLNLVNNEENTILQQKIVSTGDTTKADLNSKLTLTASDKKNIETRMEVDTLENDLILTGTSFNITGNASMYDLMNGTTQKTKDMKLAIVLPKDLVIDENNILLKLEDGRRVNINKIETKINGNNKIWIIEMDQSVYIGYAKDDYYTYYKDTDFQPISTGDKVCFDIMIDVPDGTQDMNLNTKDMFFFATQKGEFDGNMVYGAKDTWDLNENGKTTDYISCTSEYDNQLISIIDDGMVISATDSVSLYGSGSASNATVSISDKKDIVEYSIDVKNLKQGSLKGYEQYIAIPKKTSLIDGYLIKENEGKSFDFSLESDVILSGDDIFDIYYTTQIGKSFRELYDLPDSDWILYSKYRDTYEYGDVTAIKIALKKNTSVDRDFNVKITVRMNTDDNTSVINAGDYNSWASRGYFAYDYSKGKVAGFSKTNGCMATCSVPIDESIQDKARKESDIVEGYDDTPATGDALIEKLKLWIMILCISMIANGVWIKSGKDIMYR